MKYLVIGLVIVVLSGCSFTDYASTAVSLYCGKPQAERQLLRSVVAAQVAPNVIMIECAGDKTE